MSHTKPNNEIFNYDDYSRVKHLFQSKNVISYDTDILAQIINSINTHEYNKEVLNPVFIELMKYFSRDHAFIKCWGEPECCKYINSWLNMKLIKPYGLNETIFSIFEQFMKYFHKYKENERCKNQIYLIEEQKVRNMKNLYELYDKYTDLKERNQTLYNLLSCTEYDSLITGYNNFIRNYRNQNTDYLNDVIIKFKTKIENFEKISKNNCIKKDEILPPVEERPLPPEGDTAKEAVHLSEPEGKTISKEQESLELQPQLEANSLGSDHQSAAGSLTQEEFEKTRTDHILTESPKEREHSRHFGNSIGRELGSNSVYQLGSKPSYELMGQLYVDNPSQLPEDPSRDISAEQGNKEGYFSTITGTLYGIVQSVEPAPILGVSGGMGALFLLFKYTPVGTFFGGRRRRNHLIPSGFPVAYPGFPGYEEQYGANFGPGPINISYQAE
ncbi:PIR protein [Plasmodium vivax]|nr:PIR protein [Plasmodium vivax]